MDANRKPKKVKRYANGKQFYIVMLESAEHWNESERAFEVYTKRGTYLGRIESGEHQTQTRLYGNVAAFGKPTSKWFAALPGGSTAYWNDYPSQAEAIRYLVREFEAKRK